jgi:hypothetical protein
MKKKIVLLALCLFFVMVTNAFSADFFINYPFAFKARFPAGLQHLGYPQGDVLQVGCFIEPAGFPIKEVTAKNLDSGLVLKAIPVSVGNIFSGLYQVDPIPSFDPIKHMGVWEIRGKDENGNEAIAETHELDITGEMPYLEGLKASGNPLAPKITWSAPSEKDVPQGVAVKYDVRLLKDMNSQIYRSGVFSGFTEDTIPEGIIKSEDLSKIYIRVECQGWDKNENRFTFPVEFTSETFMLLKAALSRILSIESLVFSQNRLTNPFSSILTSFFIVSRRVESVGKIYTEYLEPFVSCINSSARPLS